MKSKPRLLGALAGLAMLATPISAVAKNRNHYFENNAHAARMSRNHVEPSRNFGPVVFGHHDFPSKLKRTWVPAPPGLYPVHESDHDDRGWRRDFDDDHHWDEDRDFRTLVSADPEISSRLDAAALESVFDLEATVQHVDVVFERLQALAHRGETVHV